jgi:hypothetical protein
VQKAAEGACPMIMVDGKVNHLGFPKVGAEFVAAGSKHEHGIAYHQR